jgi:hypothetical protein
VVAKLVRAVNQGYSLALLVVAIPGRTITWIYLGDLANIGFIPMVRDV